MNQIFELPDHSFSKSFRGYSPQEVDTFIEQVSSLADQANETMSLLNKRITDLEQELGRLKETEIALVKALNLAEDAKENARIKAEQERAEWLATSEKKANQLIENAKKEVERLHLVFEKEKLQQKDLLKSELLEQERTLLQLKEAQKLIAQQLMEISSVTLQKVKEWNEQPKEAKEIKVTEKKVESKKATAKPKPTKTKKAVEAKPKDDGLPTLGKVLEAYAKSNQPKGGIAEIN